MATYPNEWYLAGIQSKDRIVLQSIFQEYQPMVVNYVLANSGNEEDARDVFMDAIEALYRRLSTRELLLTSKFSTFLFEVCRRLWYKQLRRKKFQSGVTIEHPMVFNRPFELEPHFELTEEYKLLREKFGELQEDCRKLLLLSWHSGKDMAAIAKELNFTYAYARKRKHVCKERLIELIKSDCRYRELKL
jgi:RNA polymerase sigma factor (sigma-70 family)